MHSVYPWWADSGDQSTSDLSVKVFFKRRIKKKLIYFVPELRLASFSGYCCFIISIEYKILDHFHTYASVPYDGDCSIASVQSGL